VSGASHDRRGSITSPVTTPFTAPVTAPPGLRTVSIGLPGRDRPAVSGPLGQFSLGSSG
jgi:hypothetical protein